MEQVKIEIKVPEMGESVIEATIGRWLKQEGDPVAPGEPVVELETDKVNLEVGAEYAGILHAIARKAGETVSVGDILAYISGPVQSDSASKPGVPLQTAADSFNNSQETYAAEAPIQVTPVAQRMALDMGINLAQVKPGGGRITKEDVQAFVKNTSVPGQPLAEKPMMPSQSVPVQPTQTTSPGEKSPSAQTEYKRETRIRMTRRRQTIARRLVEAQHTAAMLTTFNEVDMSAVIDLRKRRREGFKERFGVDLGYMPFFVKAAIGALKAFPTINAELASSALGEEIVLKSYYDIGIAIGAEEGLVVPVVRDADRLSFAAIEKAIRDYSAKVKTSTLTLEDLRGGTFTITNGGVFGSLLSTPILNPPQVAILGMHKIQERPIALKGEIIIRPMMYLALSYDHRIVDGREAVQFLVRVKELVEDPETLLLS